MPDTEAVKALLDSGWWGNTTFVVALVAFVLGMLYAPRSCERGCPSCPWARDTAQRRRYWFWRATTARLWLVWDTVVVVTCAGRTVTDVLLGEVAWTLPLFVLFGAWIAREWFVDAYDLERVQARRRELGLL